MEKAAGQTTSWLNAGFVASNMRKPILRSMPTSGKHGRLSKAMYIPTTLSAVIQQSTIRHPHHIIIWHCWLIMMLNWCPSLTQLHISVHYKMLEFLSWQLNHYNPTFMQKKKTFQVKAVWLQKQTKWLLSYKAVPVGKSWNFAGNNVLLNGV